MIERSIIRLCKDLGCCDACCVRYLGLKNPSSYENVHQFVQKYLDKDSNSQSQTLGNEGHADPDPNLLKETSADRDNSPVDINTAQPNNGASESQTIDTKTEVDVGTSSIPPAKRMKMDDVCVTCLGILQEKTWPEAFSMVQDVLEKKRYECETIACALSSPIAAILRERAVSLHLEQACPGYEQKSLMPLKEAWKWLFGRKLADIVGKRLDSGAVAPLLVTLNVEYPDDGQELEVVRALAPALFESRSKQRRRFSVEFTRRSVEQALGGATAGAMAAAGWRAPPRPAARARAVSAAAWHAPLLLGGRYVKLSRALPQTPWLVAGRRMMHSSVQEIIFEPVAAAYGLSPEEGEQRLKLISAGREDVDVRCLGTGRPFALEIADPRRTPDAEELQRVCERISAERKVIVRTLMPITREDLTLLKQGEQTKCKTYEALCVKLGADGAPAVVTPLDLANINAYRNTPEGDAARVRLLQRTPLRVLHRRPLHARRRALLALHARAVPRRPALFALRVRAEAGTYVKEWAHGELRRTRPALADALGARADILALDVADVDLPWPPNQ
ncbi:unnamed protein product [Arctia plantaginis]|uniref:tRNA pseudouridine(55) synthase n=1 Tax=Arctia plantaginis TaxID=874455 RepID=A0A8S0ZBZ7_ARCPL|nr:unnamed protein product [Arctia plantaginis]